MDANLKMHTEIRNSLISMSEPEYQRFSSGLLPGVENILGVRLPKLRKYSRQVIKTYGLAYLEEALAKSCADSGGIEHMEDVLIKPCADSGNIEYMEEILLQGMIIGNLKVKEDISIMQIQDYIKRYLPKINNWSTCDSFCAGLKIARDYPMQMWEFLKPYFISARDYDVRFALVMIINYYINDEHIRELYEIFNNIGKSWNSRFKLKPAQKGDKGSLEIDPSSQNIYYVEMALAWAISICYVNYPGETMSYLEKMRDKASVLDDFTYNKALQKIVESRCVSVEEKARIKLMKRK